MAGHIFLISCLLAICLPIIFVQLPRFETVKELRAENEAETRSTVLRRRRRLSPSRSRKILRRITRPWSETDIDITSAESEQEQVAPEQISQTGARGRWHTGISRPIFQGDACADSRASPKEEELRKARAGKKPWDPPFRRQLPRTELVRKSPGGRWHAVTDASPPRKTGREMEARGVAMRLFPPDPVPEMDDVDEYDRCSLASSGPLQTPQEPLHRRLPSRNHLQSHDERGAPSREHQSEPPVAQIVPPPRTGPESLPSPLDGSPLPSMCHVPRSAPSTRTREPVSCSCRHCRHPHSEASVPQSPSVTTAAPEAGPEEISKQASKGPDCPCKHEDTDPSALQSKNPPSAAPKKDLKNASEKTAKDAPKEAPKEGPKAPSKAPKSGMPLWQILLVIMGFIIFVFAFAILVAHCLAWFLVYKTEARLGEVRSGLLRGGEMKMCLCGRG
ncbi:hypothetical protein BU25DRAFT_492896 [Macroventuria anomochaeta]|uniref:Uncharacterized protein n=1 Tax=Macroventuria anomochaeta TaxID=301207 RepID=A0ACB6RTC6_9PLEO|nr:uncharacterized protein BU25DRAFT_492896 [Macroventuria anomochaeta]KAF2625230.1 hypothetical protein BU25DRAFT_492896 [Macroventuria anomochaeta]